MTFDYIENKYALIAGLLSALVIILVIAFMGDIGDYKAKILLENSHQSFNMLCNTITLACATILALLLTALGRSLSAETNIKKEHYQGILNLTTVVTITFVASLFSFLLMLIPITESEEIPASYYNILYWIMLVVSALLVGMTITIALMLRKVIRDIILITSLEDEHRLIAEEDEEEMKAKKE